MFEYWSLEWPFSGFVAGNFSIPCCKTTLEKEYFTMSITQLDLKSKIYKEEILFVYILEATDNLNPRLSDLN